VYNLQGRWSPIRSTAYAFSNSSQLARNSDGSIDFYLQSTEPTSPAQASNWLPTPSGQGFEVIWRLLAPEPSKIAGILGGSGWQPPAIQSGSDSGRPRVPVPPGLSYAHGLPVAPLGDHVGMDVEALGDLDNRLLTHRRQGGKQACGGHRRSPLGQQSTVLLG